MEAKKQAGRSPAAFFAEWPLSDPAMRPTRSVTASAQALDHSLPGKPERSLPPLGLLSPREPLRWVRVGASRVREQRKRDEFAVAADTGRQAPQKNVISFSDRLCLTQPVRDDILLTVFKDSRWAQAGNPAENAATTG